MIKWIISLFKTKKELKHYSLKENLYTYLYSKELKKHVVVPLGKPLRIYWTDREQKWNYVFGKYIVDHDNLFNSEKKAEQECNKINEKNSNPGKRR
jgi:hypothetical protein